ncbi:MAG: sensor histidine kinase [Candidatus Dormibacteraeota bacterium]|nr:sensor histidine kinase [Candidatus Dormibacteraeota bacterium]
MSQLRSMWTWARRLDPRLVDAALALVLLAGTMPQLLLGPPMGLPEPAPVRAAFGALVVLPVAFRRRWPISCACVQSACSLLVAAPPTYAGLAALFISFYSIGAYSRHRLAGLLVPVGMAAVLAAVGIPNRWFAVLPAWVPTLFGGAGTWLAGSAVRDLEERARRLERERELSAQVAVATERASIARELHDVVAHSVSVMVVQAGAARTLMERRPDSAAEALKAVERQGSSALDELRRLLGLLSEEQGDAALAPAPGLDSIGPLVEQVTAAGLPVELHVKDGRPLPPGLEVTAYRVVQEALTNALKHAQGARGEVEIITDATGLLIRVTNTAGHPLEGAPGSGLGLLGMRERVALYGGQLDAGPVPDGGFRVEARFPLEAP